MFRCTSVWKLQSNMKSYSGEAHVMIETALHSPLLITIFVGSSPTVSAIVVSRAWLRLNVVERLSSVALVLGMFGGFVIVRHGSNISGTLFLQMAVMVLGSCWLLWELPTQRSAVRSVKERRALGTLQGCGLVLLGIGSLRTPQPALLSLVLQISGVVLIFSALSKQVRQRMMGLF